jgi:hypothetical protein
MISLNLDTLKRTKALLAANEYAPPPFITYEEFMAIRKNGEHLDETIFKALNRGVV